MTTNTRRPVRTWHAGRVALQLWPARTVSIADGRGHSFGFLAVDEVAVRAAYAQHGDDTRTSNSVRLLLDAITDLLAALDATLPTTKNGGVVGGSAPALLAAGERVVPVHRGPRLFVLVRDEDVTGVSGTGVVAEGAEFSDGTAVLRWTGATPTSVVWHDKGIESIERVHGHGGRTRVVWADEGSQASPHPMESDGECLRCEGCGSIANTDDGEPWTAWTQLAPGQDIAVRLGTVKPIPCPDCTEQGAEVTA